MLGVLGMNGNSFSLKNIAACWTLFAVLKSLLVGHTCVHILLNTLLCFEVLSDEHRATVIIAPLELLLLPGLLTDQSHELRVSHSENVALQLQFSQRRSTHAACSMSDCVLI